MNGTLAHKLIKPHKGHTLFKQSLHTTSTTSSSHLPQNGFTLTSLQCRSRTILQSPFTNTKSFAKGQQLHTHMTTCGTLQHNTYLNTKLGAFYATCGHMAEAQLIFYEVGLNNTFLLLAEIGRRVHGEVVVNGRRQIFMWVNLCLRYTQSLGICDWRGTRVLFDRMPKRDFTSWNTMISGYLENNNPKRTNAEFSNEVLRNALIEMYCSCTCIAYARRLLDARKLTDRVSWNSMITGYELTGAASESSRLFCKMVKERAGPDEVTIVTALGACDQITALQFGTSVHSCLVKKGFGVNTIVGTSFVDMYSSFCF